ncbi:MAG: hypothetical protein ACTHXC_12955 [Brachybacterium sp.]
MDQLSIFDELERQNIAARAADDSLKGYQARYERGELLPGESCPGCGHVFARGGYDGSRCHRVHKDSAGLICTGMELTRRHLAIALSDDPQWQGFANGDEAQRAIAAGWPEVTVRAWQADPRELLHELHAPHASRTTETEEDTN